MSVNDDFIGRLLACAWDSISIRREKIAKLQTEIQVQRQEIWLQMQSVNVLTARLKEREIRWACMGENEVSNES
jgi:hypothetical protein